VPAHDNGVTKRPTALNLFVGGCNAGNKLFMSKGAAPTAQGLTEQGLTAQGLTAQGRAMTKSLIHVQVLC
jgi:hypothetical protein